MKNISRLHYITTTPQLAEEACRGGTDWIQLRLKDCTDEHYTAVAKEVLAVCRQYGATLVINDNVAVAIASGADGVHLGKTDMDPAQARKMLGADKIVGCTANTVADIVALAELPIDYVGLGPFRFTTTKQKLSPILGLEGYTNIIKSLQNQSVRNIPIIAIGGIQVGDVSDILVTGVHGIAVSGAISATAGVANAASDFKQVIQAQIQVHHA